jgi:ribonuclease J
MNPQEPTPHAPEGGTPNNPRPHSSAGAPRMRPPRSGGGRDHRSPRPSMRPDRPQAPMRSEAPAPISEHIRVIPLGGVEEVGKNMTAVEYKNDIVIIDMGFQFPGEEAPGVDYIIPDVSYLMSRKDRIRGVFITHGHLDHTGAIPYLMDKLGNPPLYTRLLTSIMIKKRQDEFPHLPALRMEVVEKDGHMRLGDSLSVQFFGVTHTIPDAMGVIVQTDMGNIIFTGDLKVDHDNGVPLEHEQETFKKLGEQNNLMLLTDSTNVERPGWSYSERMVHENLRKIISDVPGRLIMGTFASLLERIIFIVMTAEQLGKKVIIDGRSMKTNVAIAREIGLLKCQPTTIIPAEDVDKYPPNKIIILATGAQGDEFASLMRMGYKRHKVLKIQKTDTVLLSSSIVPGNEKAVQKLKDNLSRQGAEIIHFRVADVHSSGHAYAEEMAWIIKMIKPRYFVPIHGYHHFLRVHAKLAENAGIPHDNVFVCDNGNIMEISEGGSKAVILKEKASAGIIMVDGLGNGNVQEVVIRDRQALAQDGIFVIIAVIDVKTGKVRQSPDIISRGFVYLKEAQHLLRQSRIIAKKTIEDNAAGMHPINFDYVKNSLREKMGKFLFNETAKRPIILPVILEV